MPLGCLKFLPKSFPFHQQLQLPEDFLSEDKGLNLFLYFGGLFIFHLEKEIESFVEPVVNILVHVYSLSAQKILLFLGLDFPQDSYNSISVLFSFGTLK